MLSYSQHKDYKDSEPYRTPSKDEISTSSNSDLEYVDSSGSETAAKPLKKRSSRGANTAVINVAEER